MSKGDNAKRNRIAEIIRKHHHVWFPDSQPDKAIHSGEFKAADEILALDADDGK